MSMTDSKCLFEYLRDAVGDTTDMDALEKAIWDRYGETAAVLVLDSTGFSRTTQKMGIVYFLSLIVQMREVGKSVFRKHGATGIRAEADNLFAAFPSVEQAVAAAFEMHRRFEANPLMLTDDEPYRVCVGIGYGRLLRSRDEGMFGDEMNLASKLGEDTAEGGETLLTEQAFLSLPNREALVSNRRLITVSGVELPYFAVFPKG